MHRLRIGLAGGVDCEELVRALVPMGSNEEDMKKMVRVADSDGDGEVSFKEFLRAYHTNEWFKVLTLLGFHTNTLSSRLIHLFRLR